MEALAAEVMRTSCKNCKRWHGFDFDSEGEFGRCGKFTQRYVMTRIYDTCENFVERKEAGDGKRS